MCAVMKDVEVQLTFVGEEPPAKAPPHSSTLVRLLCMVVTTYVIGSDVNKTLSSRPRPRPQIPRPRPRPRP